MKQSGMTLIEVMIVIALIALLVMAASPLTGSWVRQADLVRTEGELVQAIGRAKAIAMRNKFGARGINPAAGICLNATRVLTVVQDPKSGLPSCTGTVGTATTWKSLLNEHVTIKAGAANFSCVCFDNKGLITTATTACSSCVTTITTELTLAAGSENASLPIH